MRYALHVKGLSPLVMNSAAGLDGQHPANIEIDQLRRKKAGDRSPEDERRQRELECLMSIWWTAGEHQLPTIPESALRSCIEAAARKKRQGALVREALMVEYTVEFHWNQTVGGSTQAEIIQRTQFTAPVVVQRARILRTRAIFHDWSAAFLLNADPDAIDRDQLLAWLKAAGQRMGLGDWRPQRSGTYGRFEITSLEPVEETDES